MVSTFPLPNSVNLSQIRPDIRNLQSELVNWRRQLHQHPELGFQEHHTAEFIARKLQAWGIEHQTGIAKTGIVATIDGKGSGPVLAIRADMDALPIQEENEVSYRSRRDGIMGLMNSLAASRTIPRSEAFSTYVVDSQQALIVNDTAIAPLFSRSTLFQHHGIRAYLGVPLLASSGECLGALAVMDLKPRHFTQKEVELLSVTARWSASEFEHNRILSDRENCAPQESVRTRNELAELSRVHQFPKALSVNPSRRDRPYALVESNSPNTTDALKVQLLMRLTEELRTPLTSVMGMARILEREVYGTLADKQKEYVSIIHNSGQHLLSLVEEIVNLGVFEESSSSLHLAPVDVEMLCQQAINHLFHIAKQERQQLRLSVEPGNRIWLLDKEKVRQALYYLAFTVIQSSEAGSEVCIHGFR